VGSRWLRQFHKELIESHFGCRKRPKTVDLSGSQSNRVDKTLYATARTPLRLTADLEARTDRGGERVWHSVVRVHAIPGDWRPLAVLSRDAYEAVLKTLAGGWWRLKTKAKADGRHVLRLLVE